MRTHIGVFLSLVGALSSVSDFHKICQAFTTLRPLSHLYILAEMGQTIKKAAGVGGGEGDIEKHRNSHTY